MARARPRREPRVPLSRERVIDAALALADREGLAVLTMRRLAQELGVEAMTLYYHVQNKDDILAALVDAVMDEVDMPRPGGDWKGELRALALGAYEVLGRHRWAASLTLSLRRTSPGRMRYMESILGTLRAAGFDEDQTDHAYHVIEGHIMGFTLWEAGMNLGSRANLERVATDFLSALPPEFTHVADHVRHHLKPRRTDDEGAFAFGLELILDGLERMLATSVSPPTRSTRRPRQPRSAHGAG